MSDVLADMRAEAQAHEQWAASPAATAAESDMARHRARTIRGWLVEVEALLRPRAQVTWTCKAQKTADPPQDCNWPNCGCDPYADKVIAALEEQAPGLFQINRDNEELKAQLAARAQAIAELKSVLTQCATGECSDPENCDDRRPASLCARCRARIFLTDQKAEALCRDEP